jgi:hypothetical protein
VELVGSSPKVAAKLSLCGSWGRAAGATVGEIFVSRDLDHSRTPGVSSTLQAGMGEFSILTNRKRAIVALVHSVVFLLIALRQMVVVSPATGIWLGSPVPRSTWILCGIFAVVSAILFYLLAISRGWVEKFYFALCTASAMSGLLRTAAGDQVFHAALYIRVIMLASAILVGFMIVQTHSRREVEYAEDRF